MVSLDIPSALSSTSGSVTTSPARVAASGAAPTFEEIFDFSKEGADSPTGPADSDLRADCEAICDDGSGAEDALSANFDGGANEVAQ